MKLNDNQINDIYKLATLAVIVVKDELKMTDDKEELKHLSELNKSATDLLKMINTERGTLH